MMKYQRWRARKMESSLAKPAGCDWSRLQGKRVGQEMADALLAPFTKHTSIPNMPDRLRRLAERLTRTRPLDRSRLAARVTSTNTNKFTNLIRINTNQTMLSPRRRDPNDASDTGRELIRDAPLSLYPCQEDRVGRRGRPRTYFSPTPPPALDVEMLDWGRIACLEPRGVYIRPKKENAESKDEKRLRLERQRQEKLQERLLDDERRVKKKKKKRNHDDQTENVWQAPSPSNNSPEKSNNSRIPSSFLIPNAFALPEIPQFNFTPPSTIPSVLPLPRESSVPAQLASTFRHLDTVTSTLSVQRHRITQTAAEITQHKLGLDVVHAQLQSLQRTLDERFSALERETKSLDRERQQLFILANRLDQEVELAGDYVREFATECDDWIKQVHASVE